MAEQNLQKWKNKSTQGATIYPKCNPKPQSRQWVWNCLDSWLRRGPLPRKRSLRSPALALNNEFRSQGETADNCCCTCSIWCMAVFSGRLEFYVRLILDSWEPEWRHATQWHWSQRQIRGDAQGSEWSRWRWEINQWGKEKNSGRLLREATRGGSPGSQICESVGALWGECLSSLIACKTNCWHDDLLHLTLLPPYLRDDLQGSHKT